MSNYFDHLLIIVVRYDMVIYLVLLSRALYRLCVCVCVCVCVCSLTHVLTHRNSNVTHRNALQRIVAYSNAPQCAARCRNAP